jgi:hypothetical protein
MKNFDCRANTIFLLGSRQAALGARCACSSTTTQQHAQADHRGYSLASLQDVRCYLVLVRIEVLLTTTGVWVATYGGWGACVRRKLKSNLSRGLNDLVSYKFRKEMSS